MPLWALYAMLASVAFGMSAIPLRAAVRKLHMGQSSDLILLSSCVGALAGAVLYVLFSGGAGRHPAAVQGSAILYGAASGLISIGGSLAVIKALGTPSASVSSVMSLVNTNVFFTIAFGIVFLREIPDGAGLARLLAGAALIFAGAAVISR